eukprot:7382528-Prymnesium_polylepis.1
MVERAKSDRSTCTVCNLKIGKSCLRVGSLNQATGTFGWWCHARTCWRVPASIHLALPSAEVSAVKLDGVLSSLEGIAISGYDALDDDARQAIVARVADRGNHAKANKASAAAVAQRKRKAEAVGKDAIAVKKPAGVGGVAGSLAGSWVLTGVFPELDDGSTCGFQKGKGGAKGLIEQFGGRVASALSGKSTFLLVGSSPGMSKVEDAVGRGVKLVGVAGLKLMLNGTPVSDVPPPEITGFSNGFGGGGKARANPNAAAFLKTRVGMQAAPALTSLSSTSTTTTTTTTSTTTTTVEEKQTLSTLDVSGTAGGGGSAAPASPSLTFRLPTPPASPSLAFVPDGDADCDF